MFSAQNLGKWNPLRRNSWTPCRDFKKKMVKHGELELNNWYFYLLFSKLIPSILQCRQRTAGRECGIRRRIHPARSQRKWGSGTTRCSRWNYLHHLLHRRYLYLPSSLFFFIGMSSGAALSEENGKQRETVGYSVTAAFWQPGHSSQGGTNLFSKHLFLVSIRSCLAYSFQQNRVPASMGFFVLFLFFDIVSSLVGGHVWSSMCIQGDAPSFMVVQKEPNISGVACRFTDVSLVHYQRFRSVPTIQLDFW